MSHLGYSPAGVGNTQSYVAAGRPFVLSNKSVSDGYASATVRFDDSANRVEFPALAKSFVVRNSGVSPVRVSFASLNIPDADVDANSAVKQADAYWEIASGEEFKFDVKAYNVFISGSGGSSTIDVYAEITNIPRLSGTSYRLYTFEEYEKDLRERTSTGTNIPLSNSAVGITKKA